MKRIYHYGMLAAAAFAVAGCNSQLKNATATVSPNPLEVHADSVRATVRVTLPPKSGIKRDGTYSARAVIRNNNDSLRTFPVGNASVTADRATVKDIAKNGASRSVSIATDYREGMDPGQLVVLGTYERKGKTQTLPTLALAPCCITTSRMLYTGTGEDGMGNGNGGLDTSFVKTAADNWQNGRVVYAEAKFQFPQNVYAIRPDQYRQSDIKALGEFLKKGYQAKQVRISGFASPEGNFARNEFLSIQRSRVVQRWLMDQLKKAGYSNYLDSNLFVITTTSEDWEGFKANLDQTNYSEDVKRQIIEIINAGYEPAEQESRIMGLVGGANRVEAILAPLRRATIVMEALAEGRTPEQLAALVAAHKSGTVSDDSLKAALSQEEYLYAIRQQQSNDDRIRLTEAYTRAYPDDYRGFNNLGRYYVEQGNLDKAYDALNTANTKRANDPQVLNNLAAIQMGRGNWDDAYRFAEQAYQIQKSPVSAFILGVRAHKRANYTQAAQYFDEARELKGARYNTGLDRVLGGDLAGAKSDLDAAQRENADMAAAYYVQAIVGARSGDTNLMAVNLKQAVQKDAKFAEKAQNDLEFRTYRDSAEFKAAISR